MANKKQKNSRAYGNSRGTATGPETKTEHPEKKHPAGESETTAHAMADRHSDAFPEELAGNPASQALREAIPTEASHLGIYWKASREVLLGPGCRGLQHATGAWQGRGHS